MHHSDTTLAANSRAGRLFAALANLHHFSVSLLLHLVILVILGTAVMRVQEEKAADFVGGEEGLLVDTSAAPLPEMAPEAPQEYTPSSSSAEAIKESTTQSMDVITTTSTTRFSIHTSANVSSIGDLTGMGASGTGGAGAGGGGGMGGRFGTMMRLFGTQARGDNFVFVVDVSGSMIRGGKSEKTYEVLEKEVERVINEMSLKGTFGIVAFSRDARVYRPQLVAATSGEKQRAIRWLKKNSPTVLTDPRAETEDKEFHHGTRADRGLAEAMALKPDVIFFVSDGQPTGVSEPVVLAQVEAAQAELPKKITICSIAYLADDGQAFMKTLAEKNGGTFREVNPTDVK